MLAAFDQSMETIRSAVVGSPPFWLRHIASTLAARDVGRDCLEREQVRDRTQIASPKALLTPRLPRARLQAYDGDKATLGKAEQFFLVIAKVPRYSARTRALQVRD